MCKYPVGFADTNSTLITPSLLKFPYLSFNLFIEFIVSANIVFETQKLIKPGAAFSTFAICLYFLRSILLIISSAITIAFLPISFCNVKGKLVE